MNKLIKNPEEMDAFAKEILDALIRRAVEEKPSHAMVLGLSGPLGAGKTTFTQACARALGVTESVPSPTFVVARFYSIAGCAPFRRLVHMDAYRIESENELGPLGWTALLADPENLILVEWPEKTGERFPAFGDTLFFDVVDETTRQIHDTKTNT